MSIADVGGNLLQAYGYDEYGIPGGSYASRLPYTGQAWIPELGMYHYKARIYSPTLGRFLQTDPIGYDDQVNLYAYVANDPINLVDPRGEEAEADVTITARRQSCCIATPRFRLIPIPIVRIALILKDLITVTPLNCHPYEGMGCLKTSIKEFDDKINDMRNRMKNPRPSRKGINGDMPGGDAGAQRDFSDLAKAADETVEKVQTANGTLQRFKMPDGTTVSMRNWSTGSTNVQGGQPTIELRTPGGSNAIFRYP